MLQPSSIQFPVSSGNTVTNGASNKPTVIGRVLDSGVRQRQIFVYNGNVTQFTDPAGRQLTYTYAANNIDRVSISNTTSGTQLLEKRTYNSQHLPLTITAASGTTARFQYNAFGQPTQYAGQQGHITTMAYGSDGHLKTVTGPITSVDRMRNQCLGLARGKCWLIHRRNPRCEETETVLPCDGSNRSNACPCLRRA